MQQLVNIGIEPNDNTGDPGRVAFDKVNDNFTDLYTTRAQVKYTQVTDASRAILDSEMVLGHNIFGVNYNGDVTITLPLSIDSDKLITIKDESGAISDGANSITIQVG